ncbi:hypothetical protein V2J09_006809 [Rumex salicifolius]
MGSLSSKDTCSYKGLIKDNHVLCYHDNVELVTVNTMLQTFYYCTLLVFMLPLVKGFFNLVLH